MPSPCPAAAPRAAPRRPPPSIIAFVETAAKAQAPREQASPVSTLKFEDLFVLDSSDDEQASAANPPAQSYRRVPTDQRRIDAAASRAAQLSAPADADAANIVFAASDALWGNKKGESHVICQHKKNLSFSFHSVAACLIWNNRIHAYFLKSII